MSDPRLLAGPRAVLLPPYRQRVLRAQARDANLATSAVAEVLAGGRPPNTVSLKSSTKSIVGSEAQALGRASSSSFRACAEISVKDLPMNTALDIHDEIFSQLSTGPRSCYCAGTATIR